MNEADRLNAERIDRDRRRREDELLLLLLLLSGRALQHALVAADHGYDTGPVIGNVIAGNPALGHRGAAAVIAASMADAHRDAVRRFGRIVGESTEPPPADTLLETYMQAARDAANAMTATLQRVTSEAIGEAYRLGTSVRRAIREAFDTAGYTRGNPYAVDLGAERAVVSAYNAGMIIAAEHHGVVVGLAHHSVIDERTTDICRERDGLTLPANHPYWQNNIPALHPRCRSIVLPITGEYDASETLPTIPPMPGFGRMPAGFLANMGF